MNVKELHEKLSEYGIYDKDAFWAEAFSRDIGLLSRQEQLKLADTRVAIGGMGGVGGVHMITLVRAGIGKFHIADFDKYEPANMNRQFGAKVLALGRSKCDVMEEEALAINPFLEIKKFPEGISTENIDAFLDGVDIVLDGIDFFAFKARRLLANKAREKGIPFITAGPIGFSTALIVFTPDGMSFDDYFCVDDNTKLHECYIRFAVGIAPMATQRKYMDLTRVSFSHRRGPSLDLACQLCSAVVAAETIRVVLKRTGLEPAPQYYQFDSLRRILVKGKLRWGNRGPLQRLKRTIAHQIYSQNSIEFKRLPPDNFPSARIKQLPIPDKIMNGLLLAGTFAPSLFNVQPWAYERNDNRVTLRTDKLDLLKDLKESDRATYISIGSFWENMKIAATSFGLETRAHDFMTKEDPQNIVTLEFVPADTPRDYLFDSVWERYTNRKNYEKSNITDDVYQKLDQSLAAFPGARLHWLKTEEEKEKFFEVAYLADCMRVESKPHHEVFMSSVCWDLEQISQKMIGFPLGNLYAGQGGEAFLRATKSWSVMKGALKLGVGRVVARHIAKQVKHSSAICLLTYPGRTNRDFVMGGRAMERMWLTLTHLGLVMQPITPIPYFWHQYQDDPQGFAKCHPKYSPVLWEKYRALFPFQSFDQDAHIMVMRIGYSTPMRWASPRQTIDRIVYSGKIE